MRLLLIAMLTAAVSTAAKAQNASLITDPEAWASPALVEVGLRIAGEVIAENGSAGAPQRSPVAANLKIAYRQEGLETFGEFGQRVVRILDSAPDQNLVGQPLIAEQSPLGARLAKVEGALSRNQLDQLQLAADPLDLADLLPSDPKREAGSWQIAPEAVWRLLRLNSIVSAQVTGLVDKITPTHVKLRLAGPVDGMANGAEVSIDLRGVALFDRRTAQITQLNLGWKEVRKVGPATPGIEAVAKLNLKIQPASPDQRIPLSTLLLAETTVLDQRLEFATPDRRWRLLAERDWFVVSSDRRATTLRRVVDGRLAATTTLTYGISRSLSEDAFDQEVSSSLGEQADQIVSQGVRTIENGLTVRELAATGQLNKQPVEWRHHLLSDGFAKMTATTTLPAKDSKPDDAAVRRLIESITSLDKRVSTASRDASPGR